MMPRALVPALLFLAFVLPASAQEAAEPVAPPAVAAPYDDGLVRIAEILGAMHYLRDLCGAGEGTLWRDQMQGLIDAEQAEGGRRARFVDGFNRGYESFRTVYRACTPAATTAMERYIEEGARIARDVAARYGRQE